MSLNKKHKLYIQWIKALKKSEYREISSYPITFLTKPKEFAYSPVGVLFKIAMRVYPSQYSVYYNEEGRAKNGGYKICTMRDNITGRAYLTDLPFAIYSMLGMDSQGFAIYYDLLSDDNQFILSKKIARISDKLSMELDATAGQFEALSNIRKCLGYQIESFSLSDAIAVGLSHKVIGTLLSQAGDSDLRHHTKHDISELVLRVAAD